MKFNIDTYIKAGKESSMDVWYPKTKSLNIPQLITEKVITDDYWNFVNMIDNGIPDNTMNLLTKAADRIKYPLFMRTDQTSGKHDFSRTCYIKSKKDFETHLPALIEDNVMKDLFFQSIYLREFITLDWKFKAFYEMPVAPERRYFISTNGVVCHHPYWIEDALRFGPGTEQYESTNWRSILSDLNHESPHEIELLTSYATMVHKVLPGN